MNDSEDLKRKRIDFILGNQSVTKSANKDNDSSFPKIIIRNLNITSNDSDILKMINDRIHANLIDKSDQDMMRLFNLATANNDLLSNLEFFQDSAELKIRTKNCKIVINKKQEKLAKIIPSLINYRLLLGNQILCGFENQNQIDDSMQGTITAHKLDNSFKEETFPKFSKNDSKISETNEETESHKVDSSEAPKINFLKINSSFNLDELKSHFSQKQPNLTDVEIRSHGSQQSIDVTNLEKEIINNLLLNKFENFEFSTVEQLFSNLNRGKVKPTKEEIKSNNLRLKPMMTPLKKIMKAERSQNMDLISEEAGSKFKLSYANPKQIKYDDHWKQNPNTLKTRRDPNKKNIKRQDNINIMKTVKKSKIQVNFKVNK